MLPGYWSSTSRQHLRSYQDEYRLVTICTHGNFIVLPGRQHHESYCHWHWHWHWDNRSLSYPNTVKHQNRKWQVPIWRALFQNTISANPTHFAKELFIFNTLVWIERQADSWSPAHGACTLPIPSPCPARILEVHKVYDIVKGTQLHY